LCMEDLIMAMWGHEMMGPCRYLLLISEVGEKNEIKNWGDGICLWQTFKGTHENCV